MGIKRISNTTYALYNVLGLAVCLYGLTIFYRPLPKELADAGHFQFLTNLSLLITLFTVITNILTLRYAQLSTVNKYLNAVALVAESIVSLIYWTLKLFFINLIVNLEVIAQSEFIPINLDLSIHLFPILFLSIDYYLFSVDSFKIPLIRVLLVLSTLTLSYWSLLQRIIIPPNHYPYPFLNNVDDQQRLVIFVSVGVFGLVLYQLYEGVHGLVQKAVFKKTKQH